MREKTEVDIQIEIEVELGIELKVGVEIGVDIDLIRYRGKQVHQLSQRQQPHSCFAARVRAR